MYGNGEWERREGDIGGEMVSEREKLYTSSAMKQRCMHIWKSKECRIKHVLILY